MTNSIMKLEINKCSVKIISPLLLSYLLFMSLLLYLAKSLCANPSIYNKHNSTKVNKVLSFESNSYGIDLKCISHNGKDTVYVNISFPFILNTFPGTVFG